MPSATPQMDERIEDLQSDLDFARYELDQVLREIMARVRAGERVPVFLTRQQTALESEVATLVEQLN